MGDWTSEVRYTHT